MLESDDLGEDFKVLGDLIMGEQLLLKTQGELQMWLKERHLRDLDFLVSLPDHYLDTQRGKDTDSHVKKKPVPAGKSGDKRKEFVPMKEKWC